MKTIALRNQGTVHWGSPHFNQLVRHGAFPIKIQSSVKGFIILCPVNKLSNARKWPACNWQADITVGEEYWGQEYLLTELGYSYRLSPDC